MRWAQTASYGVLPNAAMPNTFLAQAYDLNDPFAGMHKLCFSGMTSKCCEDDDNFNATVCPPPLNTDVAAIFTHTIRFAR